jgi:hypothetical protein
MRYNLKKLKEICRTKDAIQMLQALIESERELREKLDQPEYSREYNYFAAEDVVREVLGE